MKIKKVIVVGLFGKFNHIIKVNQELGITILIGENGIGKTTTLEMIRDFFKQKYYALYCIKFNKMTFEFSDNITWDVEKDFEMLRITQYAKDQGKKRNKQDFCIHINKIIDESNKRQKYTILEKAETIPYLQRIGRGQWRNIRNGEILNMQDVKEEYYIYSNKNLQEFPDWFSERIKSVKLILIEAQRLLSVDEYGELKYMVEKYSNILRVRMNKKLTELSIVSAEIDRTYPIRLFSLIDQYNVVVDKDEVITKMKELEEKRKLLHEAGFMQFGEEFRINDMKIDSDIKLRILNQYVEDSLKKLKVFDEMSIKINLLMDIINKRFKYKRLCINKENGFEFRDISKKKEVIPLNKLSSGEQNELVLFYKLIFETEKGSVVLIDEPEISLHISWQNKFLEDLEDIVKVNHLNIIISTHSPNIIGDKWDYRVRLNGDKWDDKVRLNGGE